jgi:hypothetical protein
VSSIAITGSQFTEKEICRIPEVSGGDKVMHDVGLELFNAEPCVVGLPSAPGRAGLGGIKNDAVREDQRSSTVSRPLQHWGFPL